VHNSCMQPGCNVTYPIIADPKRELIKILNMVDPDEKDSSGHNVPSRALHIVGADKRVSSKTLTIISHFFYINGLTSNKKIPFCFRKLELISLVTICKYQLLKLI
jgi:hypothetical protein